MTKYISGELKRRLAAVVAEYADAELVEGEDEPVAVSAYVPNPGEYTRRLPVGERTELLRLAAAPAPVSPPALAEEFTRPALMQPPAFAEDPPLYRAAAYVRRAAAHDPAMSAPAPEPPWPGAAFDAERDALLAGFDQAVARMFAESDARWPIRRLRQVTA